MELIMRKFIATAVLTALSVLVYAQGGRIVERSYVATDKACYVAGDDVWCSVFCLDITAGGVLSDFSRVAYVEMIGAAGQTATCKIALEGGRGAGHFRIPVTTPTGNYRLVSYTGVNRNEVGIDLMKTSKVISVYNTLCNERAENVVLGKAPQTQTAPQAAQDGPLSISRGENGVLTLTNTGDEALTLSLSMYVADALPEPRSCNVSDFASEYVGKTLSPSFTDDFIPEYDGEIVRVRVEPRMSHMTSFISSPGNKSNIYTTEVDSTGVATFYTGNIYGEMNMVFQVDSKEDLGDYSPEVLSPFLAPSVSASDLPTLYVSDELEESLRHRSVSMQLADKFGTEILTERIPERKDLLFTSGSPVTYRLDDYTRFPTMREVIFEYVKELSIRKDNKTSYFYVNVLDEISQNRGMSPYASLTLVLLDGVPVTDHQIIIDLDPTLLEMIDIFPYPVVVGSRIFGGVANFVTYRGDMAAVKLPDSVRMLDFHGVSYPMALNGDRIDENYPDYRQTLLWQPLVTIAPGESLDFSYVLPKYGNAFAVKAEGMSSVGRAFEKNLTICL